MGKCIDLANSKVALDASEEGGVIIELNIKTDYEEPLAYHERLEGGITRTAIKLGKEATEALCYLLADHLGLLNDE